MPAWTRRLEAYSRRWTRMLALVGLLALLAQTLATIVDIVLRAVFSAPIHGLSDLYELVVIFMVVASFPASLAGNHHITVRFLGKVVPWRAREALELLGHVLTLAVCIILGWQLALHTQQMFATGQTTWLLGIPVGPSWAIATAMIVLCTPVQTVVVAIQLMRLVAPSEPGANAPGGVRSETEDLAELNEHGVGAV